MVTVAFSALSGCVTVQRPATPAPPDTAPALPTAPRPDGSTEPRVVQAPAREALEMAGPSRRPQHRKPAAPRHTTEAPPVAAPRPPAPAPAPPHPRTHPRRSHGAAPDLRDSAPRTPDVCALGRKYGGWSGDSPEARICEQTYDQ
ncbi:hypothetical protein ADK64_38955 [Streptomyces sp. MMG1121]|nr:hypothetical protein ADK64_38955 [Streptomyces sp. MMG1121]